MYTLNCNYYTKSFSTLEALIDDVINNGMDPNCEVLRDGQPTGQAIIEFIQF
jgi:hypothetical protein